MISFFYEVLLCFFVAQYSLLLGSFAPLSTEITVDTKLVVGRKMFFSVAILEFSRLTSLMCNMLAKISLIFVCNMLVNRQTCDFI